MDEFELIRKVFLPVARATTCSGLVVGPGDDCAVQSLPEGTELVFSVDTLVEGAHFPFDYPADYLGWRSLAAAASDLAAMGADPVCFTLALTLPDSDESWLSGLGRGLAAAASEFGLALAGGDTTRGPLTLTLQVHGTVPGGKAILRSGARPGNLVCVSGTLGDAGAALDWLAVSKPPQAALKLLERYHHPRPRLRLGAGLRGRATAAIDLSDGLSSDLGHILAASGVGAEIRAEHLPLSAALRDLYGQEKARALAMDSGDDYELCFTLPPEQWQAVSRVAADLTVIGVITERQGLWVCDEAGERLVQASGYNHFGER
jgi:thiamine-monophosphate kinase